MKTEDKEMVLAGFELGIVNMRNWLNGLRKNKIKSC